MWINSTEDKWFTSQLWNINLHKNEDIQYLEKETSIQRKINYILEKVNNKVTSPKKRLDIIKKELNIQDEAAIKEIMWKYYRNKYFWTLEIELLNNTTKIKTIHTLERSPEDMEEIKRLRAERKTKRHERKEKWKRKWVQTTIKFPKDKE